MNKGRVITLANVIVLVAIAALSLPLFRVEAQMSHQGRDQAAKMDMKSDMAHAMSLKHIHSEHLPALLKTLDAAIKAVESGDTKAALAQLHEAKKATLVLHETRGKHLKPEFVNNRCPIMGSPINPENVSATLMREYKGQKVAFCCGGCPEAWDKLSEAEKEAKLAKVLIPKDVWTCPMHPQIRQSESGNCSICGMKLIKASKRPSS